MVSMTSFRLLYTNNTCLVPMKEHEFTLYCSWTVDNAFVDSVHCISSLFRVAVPASHIVHVHDAFHNFIVL